jgi:hypothetical protein
VRAGPRLRRPEEEGIGVSAKVMAQDPEGARREAERPGDLSRAALLDEVGAQRLVLRCFASPGPRKNRRHSVRLFGAPIDTMHVCCIRIRFVKNETRNRPDFHIYGKPMDFHASDRLCLFQLPSASILTLGPREATHRRTIPITHRSDTGGKTSRLSSRVRPKLVRGNPG